MESKTTPTTAASDFALAQAFREAADRYKGSGHYDDFIHEVETAAALASKADGGES